MRSLSDTLTAGQKAADLIPLVKIVLTKTSEDTLTYTGTRILDLRHTEEGDRQNATVLLDNSDKVLTSPDLKGYQGIISYGVVTGTGDEYSAAAPLKVIAQPLYSTRGKLTCELELAGYPNQLGEDRASGDYRPDEDDTKTVKTHLREIFGDSGVTLLSVYNHCDSYDIVFGDEEGKSVCDLLDSYKPRDSYSVREGSSRMERIKRLLEWTKCVMRWEDDGLPHIFAPTTSGSTFDYEYSLASGYHTFFAKTYRERLVIPNYIVVRSLLSQDTAYSGSAEDTDSSDVMEKRRYYRFRVDDGDDCDDLAAAILLHYQLNAEKGYGFVPMNVGAEVHDYVKITDSREGNNRIGNIGYLRRHINLPKKIWEMRFGFGSPEVNSLLAEALPGTGGGGGSGGDIINYIEELFEMMEILATRTIVIGVAGTLTATDNASYEVPVPDPWVCERVYINVKTAPSGASLIVDVNLDGTTIFTTQGNRPTITAASTTGNSGKPDVVVFAKNQILSIDIDQIGSSVAGADLIVEIRGRLRGI